MNVAKNCERNSEIDIMRGIAIILMVYGHTFGYFRDWIYLFHMPVFFMISGYLFNPKHIESKENAYNYWFGKINKLIVPYMICNIVIMLLNNFWVLVGFLNDSEEFLTATANVVNPQRGYGFFNGYTALVNVYKVILLRYIPQLASPTWFLTVLFGVLSINCITVFYIHKIPSTKNRIIISSVLFIVFLFFSWYISLKMPEISNTFELRHLRIVPAYVAFMLGVAVKSFHRRTHSVAIYTVIGLLGFGTLLIILRFGGHIELSRCDIDNPVSFVLCALSGWFMLYYCAYLIKTTKIGKALTYIGRHTMSILFLHLICFRLVSCIYVSYSGLPKYMIASSPVIFDTPESIKIVYTIAGVVIPITVIQIWMLIKKKVKGNMS